MQPRHFAYHPEDLLTPLEVSVAMDVPLAEIDRLIDESTEHGMSGARHRMVPAYMAPVLALAAKRYSSLPSPAPEILEAHFRRRDALDPDHPFFHTKLRHNTVLLDLGPAARHEASRLARYLEARAQVDIRPDLNEGSPTLKGTRAIVHRVADAHEAGETSTLYPNLTNKQIETARLFARANPREDRARRKLGETARLLRRSRVKLSTVE